ncbi:PEP-CTERM sorting domain-containing protein [Akkermansiaceae bacterium]|nr:PEP-CTERM sorting domain-containing protein [bacterium]MDB4472070.1 PEP-CTERM sorting domain-containing protein [Akkermansiaceae bacterium]
MMELRDVKGARTNPIRLYMNLRNLLPVFFAGSLAQGAVKLDVPSSGGGAQANLTMTQTFTTETIGVENQLSEIGVFAAKVVNGNEALGRCGLNGATAGGLLGSNGSLFEGANQLFGNQYELAFNVTTVAPVPEPTSAFLFGLGGLMIGMRLRR